MNALTIRTSGPNAAIYYAQVKKTPAKAEAEKKSKQGLLSSRLNSFAETAAEVSTFVPIPYGSSVALAARLLSKVTSIFGYSKSTSILESEPTITRTPDQITTSGTELATKFALNGDTNIAKGPSNFGTRDYDQISEFIRIPSLMLVGSFDNSLLSGGYINGWYVHPECTTLVTDTTYPELSNLGLVSRLHRYWRGGMKYSLELVGSNNITCRIRVCWFPTVFGGNVPATMPSEDGKVISEVYVVRGRTIINFTVPYASTYAALRRKTSDLVSDVDLLYCYNGCIGIYVVDPIVVGSTQSSTKIWYYIHAAAAEDMVFYCPTNQLSGNYAKIQKGTSMTTPISPTKIAPKSENKMEKNPYLKGYLAQADNTTTDVVVPVANEISGLTAFADVIIPEEVKNMARADLQINANPYFDVTPKSILEQMYKVHEFSWSGSSTSGTLLHTLDFPYLLMQKSYISSILSNYLNIKADVRVKIVVNSTDFHSGTLLVTTLPFYNARSPTYSCDRMRTMSQASNSFMKYTVQAGTDASVEFVIPFVSNMFYWNQYIAPWDDAANQWAGILASLRIWVLTPLVLANSASVPTCPVTVFAKFENIQVADTLPTPITYVAQADKGSDNDITRRFQSVFPSLLPSSSNRVDNAVFGECTTSFTQLLSRWTLMCVPFLMDGGTNYGDYTSIQGINIWYELIQNLHSDSSSIAWTPDLMAFKWMMNLFCLRRGSLRFMIIPSSGKDIAVTITGDSTTDEPTGYQRSQDGLIQTCNDAGHIIVEIPHNSPLLYRAVAFPGFQFASVWLRIINLSTSAQYITIKVSVGEDYFHGLPAIPTGYTGA